MKLQGGQKMKISPEKFDELFAYIKPKDSELKWTEIEWEPDLWKGRQKAAELNKPIFIWAMNGNPLGCV